MDRFQTVTNTVCARVADLAEWLCGCPHRRTTFPMTPRRSAGAYEKPDILSNTYIVCLACGRHFAYDWSTMRISGSARAQTLSRGITTTEILHE